MDVGALVREARKAAGLTQEELAVSANLSRRAVVLVESGGGRVTSLMAVLGTLGVKVTQLPKADSIGEQVRLCRLRRKLTQAEVARSSGVSLPSVREVEKGRGLVSSLSAILSVLAPTARRRRHPKATWSNGTIERFTPPEWLEAVHRVFGPIDIDPCFDHRSFVRARRTLTCQDDGLKSKWSGQLAFVNPPYAENSIWIHRCADAWHDKEVSIVVALLPARIETAAFHDRVLGSASVILLRGKPRFSDVEGKRMTIAPFAAMFVIWGGTAQQSSELARLVNGRCIAEVQHRSMIEGD